MLHQEEGNSILHCCTNMAAGQIKIIWYPSPEYFISPSCQLKGHTCTHRRMWLTRLAAVGVTDVSQAARKEGGTRTELDRHSWREGIWRMARWREELRYVMWIGEKGGREGGCEEERQRVCPSLLIFAINPTAVWWLRSNRSEWNCFFLCLPLKRQQVLKPK